MGQGARVSPPAGLQRRHWLLGTAALAAGCSPRGGATEAPGWKGGWISDAYTLGHRWRDGALAVPAAPAAPERTDVLIVGAGIAGLSAARTLRQAGIDSVTLLELHDQPGGNARGHRLAGQGCPMGAHYLPVPDAEDHELMRWLHEIGLARTELGRTRFDERHLCHSPQERVFFDGAWHEGLLPPLEPGSAGLQQAQHLAQRIDAFRRGGRFAMPSERVAWHATLADLDRQTFAGWLQAEGITDPVLRAYLDYTCRDDYGAPSDIVSAWAGIHYFASRHGFQAPGAPADDGGDGVFTWPEGNAWLVKHLAAPLGDRVRTGWLVGQVSELRDAVQVDAWSSQDGTHRRWLARQVVLAMPLRWAARVLAQAPLALQRSAAGVQVSPWLVANLHLDQPLIDRVGVGPAWDSIVHGRESLGYVDAGHQMLGGVRGPERVITAYHALAAARRPDLLQRDWAHWSRWVVDDLAQVHADLPQRVRQVDLTRHGHAMSIPVPGRRGDADLAALRGAPLSPRVHLAHTDLVGYSVFEEAFALGITAGRRVSAALRARSPRLS